MTHGLECDAIEGARSLREDPKAVEGSDMIVAFPLNGNESTSEVLRWHRQGTGKGAAESQRVQLEIVIADK